MKTESTEAPSLHLIETCWPVFEFITNFSRQVQHGVIPPPDQVRHEALTAWRDAEETARGEPTSEKAWQDRVRSVMVYLIDYKMINTDWEGRLYWLDNTFETDPSILDHAQALGGEDFFITCDEMQKEYELAERRDRRDSQQLAEQLSIYFICLRLGFKGQHHDRPQELADYTRRLFTRLPAYASTRTKEMFPEAYKHNQELKVDYNLGMNLTIVLVIAAIVVAGWLTASRLAWNSAVNAIGDCAARVEVEQHSDGGEAGHTSSSSAPRQTPTE